MEQRVSTIAVFDKLQQLDSTLRLTTLRKDVLKIFIESQKPISAYDILGQLKKIRDSAEPPTVYRVIEYFIDKGIIHRIDAENKYIFCSQLDHSKFNYHGLIFICKKCLSSFEVMDKPSENFLTGLSSRYHFLIDDALIEIKGVCRHCEH